MGRLVDRMASGRGWLIVLGLCVGFCFATSGTGAVSLLHAQTGKVGGGSFEVTSALGRKLYALPDDESVTTARKKLAADPKNIAMVLALSKAEAGRRQYKEAVATCTKGWLPRRKMLISMSSGDTARLGFARVQTSDAGPEAGDRVGSGKSGCALSPGAGSLFSGRVQCGGCLF